MPFHYHYKCSISTCSTQTPGKIYHSFPRNEILCKIWLERIGERRFIKMDPRKLWSTHKICSRHFHKSCVCPRKNNALKTYSLPILHLPNCKLEPTPENYILSREKLINLMETSILEEQAFILEVEHNYCTRLEKDCEITMQMCDAIMQASEILPETVQKVSVPTLSQASKILSRIEQPISIPTLNQTSTNLPEKEQKVSVPALRQASKILSQVEQPISIPTLNQASKILSQIEEPISIPTLNQGSKKLPEIVQPFFVSALKLASKILPETKQKISVLALSQTSKILSQIEQPISVPALRQTSKILSPIEQQVFVPVLNQASKNLSEIEQPISVPVLRQASKILSPIEQPVSEPALNQASKNLSEIEQAISVPVIRKASKNLPKIEQPVSVSALEQASKILSQIEPISVSALRKASKNLPEIEQPVSVWALEQTSKILSQIEPISVSVLRKASKNLYEIEQSVSISALKQASKNLSEIEQSVSERTLRQTSNILSQIEQRVPVPMSTDISLKISKLDNDKKLTQSTEAIKKVAKMLARTKPPVGVTMSNDKTFELNQLNNCRVQCYNERELHQVAPKEAVINHNANGSDQKAYFNVTNSDFTNMCFICYGLKSQVTELYDMRHSYLQKSTMQSILKKVYEKLPDNTQLPQHLCLSCIKILIQTFKFLEQINAAHELYDRILFLGKDFHLINECYYRDDLKDINNLLSLCTFGNNVEHTNSDANSKTHGVDITHTSSPNSLNVNNNYTDDIVKIYTINSRERIFDIKDAECTLYLPERAKGIVQNKTTMLNDCSTQDFNNSNNGELSINPKNCINQLHDQDDITKVVEKTTLETVHDVTSKSNQSIGNCNDLLVKNKSSFDDGKSNNEENLESAYHDECTTDYKVILNMELSEKPSAEDYDDSCDVEFDEDIEDLHNFQLGKFSLCKMSVIRKYRCRVCSAVFISKELIRNHREKMRHNRRRKKTISRCRVCKLIFPTPAQLYKHTGSHRKIECKICGKNFSKTSFKYHVKTHVYNWYQKKPFIRHRSLCTKCGKTFGKNYINFHFPCAETDIVHKCNECSYVTLFKGRMEKHKMWHENGNDFRCIICNYTMTEKSSLEKHIERLHTQRLYRKMFKCIFCAQQFRFLYDLLQHRKLDHSGQKIKQLHKATQEARKIAIMKKKEVVKSQRSRIIGYKCQICDKSFSTKVPFLLHACTIHGCPIDKLQSQETTTFPVPASKAVSAEMQRYHQEFDQQPSTSETVIQTPTILIPLQLYTLLEQRNSLLIHPKQNTSISIARNLHLKIQNSDEVILPHSYETSDFGLQIHKCSLCLITFRHKTNLNNHMLHIHGVVSKKR